MGRSCKQVRKDVAHQRANGRGGNTSSSVTGAREQRKNKGVASRDLDSLGPLPCPAHTRPQSSSTPPGPQSPTYWCGEATPQPPSTWGDGGQWIHVPRTITEGGSIGDTVGVVSQRKGE